MVGGISGERPRLAYRLEDIPRLVGSSRKIKQFRTRPLGRTTWWTRFDLPTRP
jgi:hypothetical protein